MNSDVLRYSIGVNFTLLSIHRKILFDGNFSFETNWSDYRSSKKCRNAYSSDA